MRRVLPAALLLALAAPRAACAPSAKDQRVLSAAIRLYHRLELVKASQGFDDALRAVPDWKTAAGFRASCRWTLGDNAGAIADAKLAAKLRPNDAVSYAARGRALLVLKDYEGAHADFRTVSQEYARSIEGPLGEGGAFSAQGKNQEALKALNRAVSLDPSSAAALLMRGSVKDRLRDFGGAAGDYGALLEINPNFAWARFYRGKALRELKDYRASEADFSAFIEAVADNESAHYLRSNVRFFLGDYNGALSDLSKTIALNPRNGLAYSNRGQTLALLGDKRGALADLHKALELDASRRDKIQAAIDALEVREEPSAAHASSPAEPVHEEPASAQRSKGGDGPLFIED